MKRLWLPALLAVLAGVAGCESRTTTAAGGPGNGGGKPAGGTGYAVGQTAPEIAGEDIDGKPMKLSDYRGKVVVLDFGGNW